MATTNDTSAQADELAIVITRIFDASRELVFAAWTRPEHIVRWFGPRDFSAPDVAMDVRPGGAWRICIRSSEGKDYWMHGIYREVVSPERLVFTHVWEDGHGAAGHQTLVTVTLEDQAGRTKMTFHKAVLMSAAERLSQGTGWSECLDRLGDYVSELQAQAGSRTD